MSDLPSPYPPARPPTDALAMADLVNMAGEGLPLYLWTKLAAPGQSPSEVGQERARRESGAFSYRTTIVRELVEATIEMDADAEHGVRVGLDRRWRA